MASSGTGPVGYWEPLVAFVFIGAGIASVGVLLVAAGGGYATVALILTGAAILLLGGGMTMMRHAGRHDGGLTHTHLDAEQRRRYRAEFRMRRAGR